MFCQYILYLCYTSNMNITVASWNILNDGHVPKHASQSDRLGTIIKEVAKVLKNSEHMTLFLCEGLDPKHFDEIAEKTDMVVAGKPIHYRGGQKEYCGFLVSKSLAKNAKQSQIIIKDGNHSSIMMLDIDGLKVGGTHLPVKVMKEWKARKHHVLSMVDLSPDIFSGDFNATPIYPLRWRILRAGYHESLKDARPPFPYPTYRGQNLPFWLPTISIDAIFHKPAIKTVKSGHSLNSGSDHPLIWAELEV